MRDISHWEITFSNATSTNTLAHRVWHKRCQTVSPTKSSPTLLVSTNRMLDKLLFQTFTPYILHQCFPTVFCSRHLYLRLKIFGDTPSWFYMYKEQGIVNIGGNLATAYGILVSRGTPVGNHCFTPCTKKQHKSTGTKIVRKILGKSAPTIGNSA